MDRLFGTLMGYNRNNEEKETEGSWRCNVCSYENCGLLPNCEMCDNARGTEPAPTPPLVKQHPKMTPLVMVNDQGDYELYNSDKEKEKGGDDSHSTSPLDEQLRTGRETMDAVSLTKSLEEEKFKAVIDLTRAAAEGDADTLVALFKRFSSEDLDYPGALHSSASNGHVKAVKVFIEQNYDIDAVSGSLLPNTPLSLAAAGGHLEVVEYLLERGANVNKCGTDQTSSLFHAIKNGHLKIVETLLTHYASLTTGFPGTTPLILACENGHTAIANLILSKGVDVNQPGGDKQYTPLHAAAKTGNLGLVATLLLQPNINTEAADADERVPLQYAMQAGMRVHASVEQLFTTFWLEQHETLQVIRDTWRPDAEIQPQIITQEKEKEKEDKQPEEEQSLKRRTKEEKEREKKEMEELEMRLLREQQESAAKLGDSSTISETESVSSSSEGETSQVKEEVEEQKEIEEIEPTREELEAFELRLLKEQQEEAAKNSEEGERVTEEAHRNAAEKEKEEEARLQEEAERKFFEEMNRLEDMTRKEPEQQQQQQQLQEVKVEKVEEQKEKEKEEGIPLVIKLVDSEENLRRFCFRVSEDKHRNFERLFEILNQQVLNVTTGRVQLKYKDEDGDLITVCTDEDLAEAIRHAESKGSEGRIPILRVHVKY